MTNEEKVQTILEAVTAIENSLTAKIDAEEILNLDQARTFLATWREGVEMVQRSLAQPVSITAPPR